MDLYLKYKKFSIYINIFLHKKLKLFIDFTYKSISYKKFIGNYLPIKHNMNVNLILLMNFIYNSVTYKKNNRYIKTDLN